MKKVTISYSKTRYRWGKLNDCEPSRFISEIKEKYIKSIKSNFKNRNFNKLKSNKLRFEIPERKKQLKSVSGNSSLNSSYIDINQGDIIIHNRFGKGQVISTEGSGGDKKAEVLFKTSGTKKILLKFAKYEKVTS